MAWTIEYTETAKKKLLKLDKTTVRRVIDFMDKRVANEMNPRSHGKALTGPLGGLWRYRVGDYKIICKIQDEILQVLVVEIGNRDKIYRS